MARGTSGTSGATCSSGSCWPEGGHNTSPHTDSHGLATWITVQEGLFGFGWLSRPTDDESREWAADPYAYTGGRWRYVILEPGQTVFFNSGTVHFVFRLADRGQTLALGGHVLQWSGIRRWIEVVTAQMVNPHITNEDMEWSAPKYVRVVADLVEKRARNGRVDDMGGPDEVNQLLALLKVGLLSRLPCSLHDPCPVPAPSPLPPAPLLK